MTFRMSNKFILVFIAALTFSYAALHATSNLYTKIFFQELDRDSTIIQQVIEERFELFLHGPFILGFLSLEHFKEADILEAYEQRAALTTGHFKEILGYNLLDKDGRIIKVFPKDKNLMALGKVTQNLKDLRRSLAEGKEFWLSPPFKLYQGVKGFVFYFPIITKKGHSGWIAPVISNDLFFKRFRLSKFLGKNHLTITDKQTGENYYATTDQKPEEKQLYQSTLNIFGREIVVTIWPRASSFLYSIPWYLNALFSFFLALTITYAYFQNDQKKRVKSQLLKVNELLSFTAQEASFSLLGIYNEMNLMGKDIGYVAASKVSNYIAYISNLLAQISITSKLSSLHAGAEMEMNNLLPLVKEQVDLLEERFKEKDISVHLNTNGAESVKVLSNKWLLTNCVIGNILRYSAFHGMEGTDIQISFSLEERARLSFSMTESSGDENSDLQNSVIEKGLVIAKEVMKINNGKLDVLTEMTGKKIVLLEFGQAST